jgi:hypothetical protein
MTSRIFTFDLNKISIGAPNIMKQLAMDTIPNRQLRKVETPYHDNDLILTPLISPQSGWQ